MNEINELIESIIIDIAEEGVGAAAGLALLWGLFFGGTYVAFNGILTYLSSTI